MTTTDLEVFVEYGFIELTGGTELADLHLARQGQRNGICGAQVAGHLSMVTGTHTGHLAFRVEMHENAPAVDDLWEEVVEVSVELPAGSMQLATQITFPHARPVEGAMRALANGYQADAEPQDFLEDARALVAALE